jgi:hypothetical protein
MIKSILRDRQLLILFFTAITLKLFTINEARVEQYYTYGVYPVISKIMRSFFGWIPFSIGDMIYLLSFVFIVLKTWKLLQLLALGKIKEYLSWTLLRKYLRLMLWIYLIFNICWGLNYNRVGIATQFGLDVQPYTLEELYTFTNLVQQRVCFYGDKVDSLNRIALRDKSYLFRQSIYAYKVADAQWSFFRYEVPSIKSSLYTPLGHLFGFTGYYNPFSGEAQLKTNIPVFLQPFVACHEIAHQLGYAKENEANFAGFLVARTASNDEFRYSAYYEIYSYAIKQLYKADSTSADLLLKTAHPQYRADYRTYYNYLIENRNYIEPFASRFYDNYLKMNNQSKGLMTYNEVVAWLIAYMKKYGQEAI